MGLEDEAEMEKNFWTFQL